MGETAVGGEGDVERGVPMGGAGLLPPSDTTAFDAPAPHTSVPLSPSGPTVMIPSTGMGSVADLRGKLMRAPTCLVREHHLGGMRKAATVLIVTPAMRLSAVVNLVYGFGLRRIIVVDVAGEPLPEIDAGSSMLLGRLATGGPGLDMPRGALLQR